MSSDIFKIEQWVNEWQMQLHIRKCELLYTGYSNLNFPYTLDDVKITFKTSCEDFGFHASNNLSFSKHCGIISRNFQICRRQFQQSFSCKDVDFSVFIACTYIRPLVEYNSVIWSPHLLCNICRIENVQRKFTRSLQGLHNILSWKTRVS